MRQRTLSWLIRISRYSTPFHILFAPWGIAFTTWWIAGFTGITWKIWELWRVWNIIIPISDKVDAGTVLYGMGAALLEGGLRLALWAIRESQQKIVKSQVGEIERILSDPDFKPTAEQRELLEQRKTELRETVSR